MQVKYRVRLKPRVKLRLFIALSSLIFVISFIVFKLGNAGATKIVEGNHFKAEVLMLKDNLSNFPARSGFYAKYNYSLRVRANKRVFSAGSTWKVEVSSEVCIAELIEIPNNEIVNFVVVNHEKCT